MLSLFVVRNKCGPIKKIKEVIEELSIYKVIKSSEEKALKNKQKKLDKKLKKIESIKTPCKLVV